MRKFKDLFSRKEEPKQETAEDKVRSLEEALESLSSSKREFSSGTRYELKGEGMPLSELAPVMSHVPWAALTSEGTYMVALPGPAAMATMTMLLNHAPVLCAEIQSLVEACKTLTQFVPDRSAYATFVNETAKLYELAGHGGDMSHPGSFGFREEPTEVDAMIYGMLTQHQLVELATTVKEMGKTKPTFSTEGIDKLFDAVIGFWIDMLEQVGPAATMELLGEGYEGKA